MVNMDQASTDSINPFRKLRGDLTLHQWSRRTGVSVPSIVGVENGVVAHPRTLLAAMKRLGHDEAALDRAYQAWRSLPPPPPPVSATPVEVGAAPVTSPVPSPARPISRFSGPA